MCIRDRSGRRIICPLQWGFVVEVEANLISTPVSIDAIISLLWFAISATWLSSTENPCSEDLAWPPIPDRMCNRIQGRTPVFGSCVVLVLRCVLDAVSHLLLKQHLMFLMWTKWTCGLPSLSSVRFWFLRWSSVLVFMVVVYLSFVVSEMDHGLLRSIKFWFLRWISCSLLTLFGIRQRFVAEVDLAGVVVGTFSCWSDFNMRASVKHELLGHGFHDELFN